MHYIELTMHCEYIFLTFFQDNRFYMDNELKDRSLRLKEIREKIGLTPKEMAKQMAMQIGSYRNKEYGRDKVTEKNVDLLKLRLNVNPDYILHGKGEMFEDGINPLQESIHLDMLNQLLHIEAKADILANLASELKGQIRTVINQINRQIK